MTGKRATAIISAYFGNEYLEGRIENLENQTDPPEIIAVAQKGSACAEILERHSEITTILTDDIPTVYAAWNIGIKAATTPYVTNANTDDRLARNAIKAMADILDKESTYGVVYPDVDIVEEIYGNPVNTFKWIEGGLPELLKGCFVGPMPMWRKSLHDRYGYFDETLEIAGDYEFWLRLASNGVKFYHVRGAPLGAYLDRPNSREHREPLKSLWEANKARMKYRRTNEFKRA